MLPTFDYKSVNYVADWWAIKMLTLSVQLGYSSPLETLMPVKSLRETSNVTLITMAF